MSRLKALSKVGTTVIQFLVSAEGVIACSVFDSVQRWRKNRRGSRSGRTLRVSSSSAGRPRHESSIAKNYLESSSIEKNCLRSSSTWTSGVHRDKESLPNSPKLQSLTRFQPGHQPENWRTLQEEEATLGSVSISSGTSVVVLAVTSVPAS